MLFVYFHFFVFDIAHKMKRDTITDQFFNLCKDMRWNPPISDLENYIQLGVNVNYKPSQLSDSVLHEFVRRGLIEHVRTCLLSPHDIDFTQRGRSGQNVLHVICSGSIRDEATSTMLHSIVQRIQSHPTDKVDWSQKDGDAMHLLAIAADNQKLSLIWKIIAEIPYFADQLDPFPLRPWVWSWDWEALADDQAYFSLDGVDIVQTDCSTAKLVKLCWIGDAEPSEVEKLVEDGADLCFQQPGVILPLLHQLLNTGSLSSVQACLKTPRVIDFTVTDLLENTALHHICLNHSGRNHLVELLHMVLDRLQAHPGDIIDWSLTNRRGDTFLSLAAKYGVLSVVWEILQTRKVSFFTEPSQLFLIKHNVKYADWVSIKEDDRKFFALEKGIPCQK